MGRLGQDLRFTLRNLRRTPLVPLAAVATLAIGIAATTAIFSIVNTALLKPLPYPGPNDLYTVKTNLTDGRPTTGLLSPVELLRLGTPNLSVVRAAGLNSQDLTLLLRDDQPIKMTVYGVTDGFFDLFGLPMTLGSLGHPVRNGPPTVVISYRIWRDLYGSDPGVVGKPVRFAEGTPTVGGVAPREFDTPHGADFWFANPLDPQNVAHTWECFMRLKPGTSIDRARSELAGVMASVSKDFPASTRNRVFVVKPMVDSIVGDLGPILLIVLSATGLLLVLACVNVTNLLLARGAARAREMAVRVALGAGRGQIILQLLTESLVLATAGAVVGVFAAYGLVRALLALGASRLPRLDAVAFDARLLIFVVAVLIITGLLVGFAPALRLAATDVRTLMNESGRSASGGRRTGRWLMAMTVVEIALAVMLVAGAGWLVRGFSRLQNTDPGFAADGRLAFDLSLQRPQFRESQGQQKVLTAYNDLLDRLRQVNGVSGAGLTSHLPLRGGQETTIFVHIDGDPLDTPHTYNSRQRVVSPRFFETMGVRLLAGRDFNGDDKPGTAPVAIVNSAFARRYLEGRDPLTARFSSGYPNVDPNVVFTVVGVVDDVRQRSLSEAADPAFYNSSGQGLPLKETIVVHTSQPASPAIRSAIRAEVTKTDPQAPVDIDAMSDVVAGTLSRQQLGMTLMLWFGVAAVALAAVGVYGVVAFTAAERRTEVATRLALGATPGSVFWLMLKQSRNLTAIGAVIGLIAASLSGRFVSSRVSEIQTSDPMVLTGATALVVAIALVATAIPAVRASRVHPSRVLRPD